MKNKLLCILLIGILLLGLTGCGDSVENKNNNLEKDSNKSDVITEVGDLTLEIDQGSPFKEGLASVKKDGKYGYIDKTGKIIVDIQYDAANNFYNGFAAVKKDGKWGYIDKTGKVIIDFKYDEVGDFSKEGLAPVKNDNFKWGYIDNLGKTIIDFQYMDADEFYEGIAKVKRDYQEYFYIDTNGKAINDSIYKEGSYCSDGLIAVAKDEKHRGYIDKTGKIVIDFKYLYTSSFKNGLALVHADGKALIIDKFGNTIYDETDDYYLATNFSEERAGVSCKAPNSKHGFIDKNGKVVIECKYETFNDFSEGLSAVKLDSKGKYGFIDQKGNKVIDYLYDSVSYFSEGLVSVKINGKVGYINKEGKVIIGNLSETTNSNENKLDDKLENNNYNLSGTYFGIHTQDSEFSQIDITNNNITWGSPGVELVGTFAIEDNKIKATWSDGTTSTLTIVSDKQLKATEPFSSSGELVVFNKK